jgi:hypothetical protein
MGNFNIYWQAKNRGWHPTTRRCECVEGAEWCGFDCPIDQSSLESNDDSFVRRYRLEHMYMPQPRLMKLSRNNIDGNCLSTDVASIALAYFLNPPHPSLKYVIQFFLINNPQNLLQALKQPVLVSHLNPFEFFFQCRKQVEITRSQIRWIELV